MTANKGFHPIIFVFPFGIDNTMQSVQERIKVSLIPVLIKILRAKPIPPAFADLPLCPKEVGGVKVIYSVAMDIAFPVVPEFPPVFISTDVCPYSVYERIFAVLVITGI